jgi:TonB family protein
VKKATKPSPAAVASWNNAKSTTPRATSTSGGAPKATAASSGRGSPSASQGEINAYNSMIKSVFHSRWSQPKNINSRVLVTRTQITIAPDGRIVSARIVTPSGVRELDASVDRSLRAVSRLRPLPKGIAPPGKNYTVVIRYELKPNAYEY